MTMTKMTPFRMIGNLYFVGTKEASSHLIATEEGLIIIDSGYAETAEAIIESVTALGFSMRDVKIILHSHGHGDHTWGTPRLLREAPDAKTYLCLRDLRYLNGAFTPDCDLAHGQVIRLGSTEILCLFSPGHTEGAFSFFFDVTEDGQTYRAAMFGGAGVNQLKKPYMNRPNRMVSYLMRGAFFDTVERLEKEHVDVMVGNHTWHNATRQKYEKMVEGCEKNPFIDPEEWGRFLRRSRRDLEKIIAEESRALFANYAHRGASAYCPENTMLSFYMGIYMGANGIETDVRATKDGTLVLFHDDTLARVCDGAEGGVCDYTYEELCAIPVKRGELYDRIPTFEDFLAHFADRDLTFAIELKDGGIEKRVADLILGYGIEGKCVVTSFNLEYLRAIKKYAPRLRVGLLTREVTDDTIANLIAIGADEICPHGQTVSAERVAAWHRLGFNVRAWGIGSYELMARVYDAGADGMTVNFPDRLLSYVQSKSQEDRTAADSAEK